MEEKTQENSWYVYIMECSDGSLYTGITNDPGKRLLSHNSGKASKYTRSRLPVKMVYLEQVQDKGQALSRERAVKKLKRHEKLELTSFYNLG